MTSTEAPTRLRLRRLGIDTYQVPVLYMHRDDPVCRSEGFEAQSRVELHLDGHSVIATLNVVHGDFLALGEAGVSEAAVAAGRYSELQLAAFVTVSTGQTLIAAAQALRSAGWSAPTAVAVHALMEREDVEALHRAGVPRIVSCDTVTHPSNAISVRGLLGEALRGMLA
jgi:hypothetical protein